MKQREKGLFVITKIEKNFLDSGPTSICDFQYHNPPFVTCDFLYIIQKQTNKAFSHKR